MRPAVQRMSRPKRCRFASRQHQSVTPEMPERESFGVQLFEHRRHLGSL